MQGFLTIQLGRPLRARKLIPQWDFFYDKKHDQDIGFMKGSRSLSR